MNHRKRPIRHAARSAAAEPDRGRKRSTINDIARMANVSKKTVSRVINDSPFVKEETRLKINEIIRELGFVPDPQARGLAFRRSFLIGMIYDNPTAQYVVNMQQGILDAMKGTSFELVIRPCDRQTPTFLADMRSFVERQKLFGVVLTPSVSEDDRLVKLLHDIDCPYVRIASVSLDSAATMVVTHDCEGAADAARHLADLGHHLIAHISGPPTFRSAHERRRGFTEALAARAIKIRAGYDREGAYTFDSGIALAQELLKLKPRPTAIFTGNDEMAAGVYKVAHDMGLSIPHDLSVIGFDDSPVATRLWPVLTTVRLPIRDMGRMAAEKLIKRRSERRAHAEDVTEVIPSLIVRESTGPASRP
ncbi:MAG: LacI family DNA-binding transcriptional regulator [Alphaproteobacteria bacterium]|nr:LacI family DNA-binding transcriptional regulator [Alphaproteobacteria bacterium]